MMDIATCAMAFRLLRMNCYDVSSDELCHVAEASTFCDSLQGYLIYKIPTGIVQGFKSQLIRK